MNISAISMVNRMPSFAGKKYPAHYEKGPNGEMGVWTRNGGDDVFFTPASEIEKREHQKPVKPTPTHISNKVESEMEYLKRKLLSPEYTGR